MISGGFDLGSLFESGIGAVGNLLEGIFSGDGEQPLPETRLPYLAFPENRVPAMALLQARLFRSPNFMNMPIYKPRPVPTLPNYAEMLNSARRPI